MIYELAYCPHITNRLVLRLLLSVVVSCLTKILILLIEILFVYWVVGQMTEQILYVFCWVLNTSKSEVAISVPVHNVRVPRFDHYPNPKVELPTTKQFWCFHVLLGDPFLFGLVATKGGFGLAFAVLEDFGVVLQHFDLSAPREAAWFDNPKVVTVAQWWLWVFVSQFFY